MQASDGNVTSRLLAEGRGEGGGSDLPPPGNDALNSHKERLKGPIAAQSLIYVSLMFQETGRERATCKKCRNHPRSFEGRSRSLARNVCRRRRLLRFGGRGTAARRTVAGSGAAVAVKCMMESVQRAEPRRTHLARANCQATRRTPPPPPQDCHLVT